MRFCKYLVPYIEDQCELNCFDGFPAYYTRDLISIAQNVDVAIISWSWINPSSFALIASILTTWIILINPMDSCSKLLLFSEIFQPWYKLYILAGQGTLLLHTRLLKIRKWSTSLMIGYFRLYYSYDISKYLCVYIFSISNLLFEFEC